jgi:acyl transferase domain-containing protein/aryl carrier-like protein
VVVAEVAAILGAAPGDVERRTGFFDAGMDSLMAVELSKRLKARLERPLPATVAFDHPNVEVLTDWLLQHLKLEDLAAPAVVVERRVELDAPIAVVGLSCRMPGGANDPESFWELLRSGRDPMREVPPERWDLSEYYDPTPGTPGKMYTRFAGWMDTELVESFDPEFFGISGREAESLDPQQRVLLEVAYEALERAGLTTPKLYHSRTGVFVGVGSSGYHQRFQQPGGPLYVDQYAGTGALEAFVSGRVAYVLGLHGPNLALNTACSSTLVALHLACQSLRTGDAELALAGGVHLMLSPENFVYVSQIKAVSPDGRCKTFDASADGYGRAEACGMLALKRLADAERDGDPVLAVIRGTAVGHDGPSSGLTVPYGPAQVQVLSDAVARSGLHPHDVSYLEAHGTGTVLGDPIEVHAIEEVYCQDRKPDNPLHLGAVKSNIGHAEVAAGAASLVKMVLALQHREIPPHLHFREPNPDLDLDRHALQVDTAPVPWRSPRGALRAGISGFGLAGTNVHLVIEEAPPRSSRPRRSEIPERPAHLLTLSARADGALRELAIRYAKALEGGASLPDVAFSAATTRIPYEQRLALVAPDAAIAAERLRTFAETGDAPFVTTATAAGRPPKVAFLFSGQGSQYPGMGQDLYDSWPVFRAVIDRCVERYGPSLRDALFGPGEQVHDTTFTQPALFAIEVALAELWKSWGIEPALVLGHSIGQIAAATVAGVFTLEDGLRLVAERGRLMGALPREGAMLAVFADEATVRAAAAAHGDALGIAAVNNPGETTVSGRTDAIDALAAHFAAQGVETRRLTVSHAFHSPLMDPMLDAFEAVARTVAYRPAKVPVGCNLTGKLATDAQLSDPRYWRDLVRSAVRFADGLQTVEREGAELFVEIGPHTALLGMGRRTLTGRHLGWFPSLQRGEPAHDRILPSLGALWARGVGISWEGYDRDRPRERVALPTYPWQRRRVWLELEEFPGRKAQAAQWLVEPTWEPRSPVGGTAAATLAIVGSGPDFERVRAAVALRGARLLDDVTSAEAEAVIVVPAVPDGIGADPSSPASMVLQVTQQLAGRAVPLTVVTRGAVPVAGPVTRPLAATLWGLVRVVRAEYPELKPVLLDLDSATPDDVLVDALVAGDREPEVALRDGVRHVMRLARGSFAAAAPPALDDGAVLVTGGLGGLGLETARWLAEHGAKHLVLTGRSAPSADAEAVIGELRGTGVEVVIAQGDVANEGDVERIVGAITQRGVPLIGVVHAAGVLADAALPRLDTAALRATFAPKVKGSWNLHLATTHLPLRFFVLFAAGAGLMGSPGQGNYAAANAFEDALAHWRRGNGLPAVAIDWGTWAEVGMAARAGERLAARQAEEGMRRIPLRAGLEALGRLLHHPQPQVAVLNVDWDRLVATVHRGTRPATLERLASDARPTATVAATAAGGLPALLQALAGKPRGQWDEVIEGFVEAQAARILRLPPGRVIDRTTPLLDLGLDSLLAVELKNAITDAGVDLAVARVMTGPSIRQIGQMVVTALDESPPPEVMAQAPTSAGPTEVALPPPVDPILSHLVAFAFGVVFVVLAYLSSAFWEAKTEMPSTTDDQNMSAPTDQAAPPAKAKAKAKHGGAER